MWPLLLYHNNLNGEFMYVAIVEIQQPGHGVRVWSRVFTGDVWVNIIIRSHAKYIDNVVHKCPKYLEITRTCSQKLKFTYSGNLKRRLLLKHCHTTSVHNFSTSNQLWSLIRQMTLRIPSQRNLKIWWTFNHSLFTILSPNSLFPS